MTTPPPSPEHDREGALLNAALELAAGERAAFLDRACAGDAALRQRVSDLLQAHAQAGAFLGEPAFPTERVALTAAGDNGRGGPAIPAAVSEAPGDRIGHYKLLEKIGEGGCGVVYMAEQAEPIRRRVALKVIKLGMDTKQVINRFEAERQALALMDHPNIARVLDGGATDTGRPFFVMELVRGIRITDYCDQNNLSTRDRLDLFMQVCRAIQHAHQKGVIHRDIKPSNILVTVNDGVPTPKVIDFGIAKATSRQRLTDKTLFTAFEQFVGTPAYMSPEQAEMTSLDVDTRSDIYALGVLLYELLTGKTPFDAQSLMAAGLDEMVRIIREQEPVRPSTRLSTMAAGELSTTATRRQSEPPKLIHLVRGDLDWIVMKCLDKDRARRYETANGLARDIERHLKHEPVVARPPSVAYRLEKSFRRNRLGFTAAGLVGLALVLGAVLSTWQAIRATNARRDEATARGRADAAARVADSERERAEQEERKTKASELFARQEAYASDMNVAQHALGANDLGRAKRLLERHRPRPGEPDLRGWEWRYLWRECRSDALSELCRHPNSVNSVAYSFDGQTLSVAGGFVEIWDVPARKQIATLAMTGHVVAFSRGNLLAANSSDETINVWQAGTTNLVHQIQHAGEVKALKFSRDGTRLASLNQQGEVTVWEADRWTVVRQVPGPPGYGGHDGALDFSPDGQALVFGHADGSLHVVNLDKGATVLNIPAHPELTTAVAWSPTAPILASGSGYSGGPIRLWDANSGKSIGALEGHTSWITRGLIFSADGRRLYSASGDQTIKIWDVPQQRCLATLRGSSDEVYGLALSPDGATLASASKDGIVAFWSALPGAKEEQPRLFPSRPGPEIPHSALNAPHSVAFAPDGRALAEVREGIVRLRALPALSEMESITALGTNANVVAYSPDGALIVSGSDDGWLRVWSCGERRLLQALTSRGPALLYGLGFSNDGLLLMAMEWGGAVTVWNTRTWQRACMLRELATESASLSPDGRHGLTGRWTGELNWWETTTGGLLVTVTPGRPSPVSGTAFSPDAKRAASVAEDGTVALWDASSFACISSFKGHMLGIHSVAFSPDGRRLATGGGSGREAVKLWDVATCREMLTLPGEGSIFGFVAFSPDGNWLLARSSLAGHLHLWRAPSWAEIDVAEKRADGKAE
jgi:WD40 repeat protein/serine/threonine protein kinase